MKLTKEEKELILKKRAIEEAEKPKMIGELKEDLYSNDCYDNNGRYCGRFDWLCSAGMKDRYVAEFADSFEKVLSAGVIFDCYIKKDGHESWYDREYGIEDMSEEWARKNLINIKKI